MAAATLPPPAADDVRRKRFTRAEVDRLEEIGFFNGNRYELIEGELIDKMGQKPPHANAIMRVLPALAKLFSIERLRCQAPMEVGPADWNWNLPEPDLAVVPASNHFSTRHPQGDEVLLVVEVADTSLRQDRITKRDLYARAQVQEYWVVDIPSRRLIVYKKPIDGEYSETFTLLENESVRCGAHPEDPIAVLDLLP